MVNPNSVISFSSKAVSWRLICLSNLHVLCPSSSTNLKQNLKCIVVNAEKFHLAHWIIFSPYILLSNVVLLDAQYNRIYSYPLMTQVFQADTHRPAAFYPISPITLTCSLKSIVIGRLQTATYWKIINPTRLLENGNTCYVINMWKYIFDV